jgi:hypothetical protein
MRWPLTALAQPLLLSLLHRQPALPAALPMVSSRKVESPTTKLAISWLLLKPAEKPPLSREPWARWEGLRGLANDSANHSAFARVLKDRVNGGGKTTCVLPRGTGGSHQVGAVGFLVPAGEEHIVHEWNKRPVAGQEPVAFYEGGFV